MNSILIKQSFIRLLVFATVLMMPFAHAFSQDNAKPKKAKARLSLEFFNNLTTGPYLKATAKTKVDRSYGPVVGETINFHLAGEEEKLLGKAKTNEKGVAKLLIDKSLLTLKDSTYVHAFKAAIKGSERYKNRSKEIEITEAKMEVTFSGDSVYQIAIHLTAPDSSGAMAPVEDAVVKPFVQRLFSLLPVGEEAFATDEAGELVLDFPNDIPGDENGVLKVVVKLSDHETYGNIILEKDMKWGVPVTDREVITEGELWASRANAPLWLVIFVNSILIGIWGTIVYIVFQLIKISKISRAKTA